MKRDRAAYMREYRKRQRRETVMNTTMPAQAVRDLIDAQDRIKQLEEEVRHLKAELAKRPPDQLVKFYEEVQSARRTHTGHRDGNPGAASDRFNTRPFTPVPKRK